MTTYNVFYTEGNERNVTFFLTQSEAEEFMKTKQDCRLVLKEVKTDYSILKQIIRDLPKNS